MGVYWVEMDIRKKNDLGVYWVEMDIRKKNDLQKNYKRIKCQKQTFMGCGHWKILFCLESIIKQNLQTTD